jgi:hypothetical protein
VRTEVLTTGAHVRCSRQVLTAGAHDGCARRVRTTGAHDRCGTTGASRQVRTTGAHDRCSRRVLTSGAHVRCARQVRTSGAHDGCARQVRRTSADGWVRTLCHRNPTTAVRGLRTKERRQQKRAGKTGDSARRWAAWPMLAHRYGRGTHPSGTCLLAVARRDKDADLSHPQHPVRQTGLRVLPTDPPGNPLRGGPRRGGVRAAPTCRVRTVSGIVARGVGGNAGSSSRRRPERVHPCRRLSGAVASLLSGESGVVGPSSLPATPNRRRSARRRRRAAPAS